VTATPGSSGDDHHGHGDGDVGVELDDHVDLAELLHRLVETDATTVDLDAALSLDRVGDVGRGDGAEELAALSGAAGSRSRAVELRALSARLGRVLPSRRLRRIASACATTPFVAFIARPRDCEVVARTRRRRRRRRPYPEFSTSSRARSSFVVPPRR
jgi:hypothetical protein